MDERSLHDGRRSEVLVEFAAEGGGAHNGQPSPEKEDEGGGAFHGLFIIRVY